MSSSAGGRIIDICHHYGVLHDCVVVSSHQLVYHSLEFLHVEENVQAENVFFKDFQEEFNQIDILFPVNRERLRRSHLSEYILLTGLACGISLSGFLRT